MVASPPILRLSLSTSASVIETVQIRGPVSNVAAFDFSSLLLHFFALLPCFDNFGTVLIVKDVVLSLPINNSFIGHSHICTIS